MSVVIAIVVIFLVWLIFGSRINAWIRKKTAQFIANRTEDYIRKATGMPPRDKSKSSKKQESRSDAHRASGSRAYRSYRSSQDYYDPNGPIIPKEYAEDVEFVEIKEFSQTDIDARFADGSRVEYHESQVSDVEWVEIKSSGEEVKSGKRWKK